MWLVKNKGTDCQREMTLRMLKFLFLRSGALRLKMCLFLSMQWCAAVGVSVSRVRRNSVPVLIGSVPPRLWRCGTVPASRRSVRGNVVVPLRFVFRVVATCYLCARALLLSWSVRGNYPGKSQVFLRVGFCVFQSFCIRHLDVFRRFLFNIFVPSFTLPRLTYSVALALSWSTGKMSVSATTREGPRADPRVFRYASACACGRRSFQHAKGLVM